MPVPLADAPVPWTAAPPTDPARRLQTTMAATQISFTWFGVRKTLSAAQRAQAADSFRAEATFLSAAKKLLDTRHSAYQAVTAVRGRVLAYWRALTLPYPEPGLRLIRQDDLAPFDAQLHLFRDELHAAVVALDAQYADLQTAARQRLGELYNPADYPRSLRDEFALTWAYPATEPPDYLRQLHPQLYQQECQRVQQRFDEALALAEQAFLDELAHLIGHLTERLAGTDDGKPKIFRDSAVDNLTIFFDRFRRLNVRSHAELEQLVDQAQGILRGVHPQKLRDSPPLRQRVSSQMAGVQATLDQLLVERPRRSILRPKSGETD